MSLKSNTIHIRLDDEQKTALEKIVEHHRARTLGEASYSSVIRALIIVEYRRLYKESKS